MNRGGGIFFLLLPFLWVGFGMGIARSGWTAMLGYHISMAVCLWWDDPVSHSRSAFSASWAPPNSWFWRLIPWSALLTLPFLLVCWPWVGLNTIDSLLRYQGVWPFWPFAVYYPLVNPLLEEFFWRRFVNERLSHKWLGDAFFGAYHALVLVHFVTVWFAVLCAAAFIGVAWGWRAISRKTGSLYVALVSHFAANVGIVGCVGLLEMM
ncbi:MAG: CPBP family intramembrane metalloprotease [Deltaproteobacteria bacterium]|nr:CPBP family intramembrane metalloprotease [Deltaproteobacteria bacterium]MBN2672266.1 CPBP family intramembrane metalloprotease [Deltaproteobacteria bacterium]